ncbi:MAG: CHAT domain-containing protein [Coleofasciculus sp. D1-CHI-01]|uniref:CHAT domain-containing protein n=1 Tax=Coleofasciculus sp. D1-CHI-01 TaxID=3068482 RepID=UPI0032FD88B4
MSTPIQFSRWLGIVLFIPLVFLKHEPLQAESITAADDGTTTIINADGNQFNITGGTLSGDGANLFHSFQQFGLDANQVANFLSNPQIINILGRVSGNEASIINGLIQVGGGNSNLFLMNPSGFIFGSDASLNVPGSFTATTANGIGFAQGWFNTSGETDYQSLVGSPNRFAFTMDQPGSIINAGELAVSEGEHLTLLAGQVINTGTLSAPGGTITMTAVPGENVVRISQAGMLLSLEIEAATAEDSLATAEGISPLQLAELLTGQDEESTGVIVDSENTVRLIGSDVVIPTISGTTILSGVVDTSSEQFGGNVYLVGEQVGVINATINASGSDGGGTVLIGGGFQGQGSIPNALQAFVSSDSIIYADALEHGNAGLVVAWADEINRFSGSVSATGGETFGDGGLVEISARDSLIFRGLIDVGATSGNLGTILFDPKTITISDGGTDDLNLNNAFGENSGNSVTFDADQINALMGNVVLQANNDITINQSINASNISTLTLQAGKSITINNVMINLAGGNFSATINDQNALANQRDGGVAQFEMNSGSQISTNGGNISIKPGSFGNEVIGTVLLQGGTLNSGDGTIEITGRGSSDGAAKTGIFLSNGAVVESTGTGTITLEGTGGSGTSATRGIEIQNPETRVSSENGDILINGIGGDSTGNDNFGLFMLGGVVESTGTGNIILEGTAGTGTDGNRGIQIQNSGTVSSNDGDILLSGAAENATGNNNFGIFMLSGGVVESTGSGNITLEGTGGTEASSRGIQIQDSGTKVSSNTGDILLSSIGQDATASDNIGISLLGSGTVETQGIGNITLTSDGSIDASSGILDSSSPTNGGTIALTSQNGAIITGDINTSGDTNGGDVVIEANREITTGKINTTGGSGGGGTVNLNAPNDIQVSWINTEGGTTGGAVDVNTDSFFRATDIFTAANGIPASISTIGGSEGGNITISHGGENETPFEIGDATTNGIAAALTSGSATISPVESFASGQTTGNIQIIGAGSPQTPVPPDLTLSPDVIYNLYEGIDSDNIIESLPFIDTTDNVTQALPIINASTALLTLQDAAGATNRYIESLEQARLKEFADYFGRDFSQYSISLASIEQTLAEIERQTGNRSAVIYAVTEPDGVKLVLFTAAAEPVTKVIPVNRDQLLGVTNELRVQLTDAFRRRGNGYLKPAQQLYQWLIAPIASELEAAEIDTLLFSMDAGLRTIPMPVLHDGEQFLIENYSLSMIPTFSLMNSNYQPLTNPQILAMGASEFTELNPLPAVPVELSTIAQEVGGQVFLNQEFTLENLIQERQRYAYEIIHLGTHADFKSGGPSNSYVQLWNDKLTLAQMQQMNWDDPPVELLVLSACRTAVGDNQAELGFAGLAVASGVKSALGSVWQVSDQGTLALMTELYNQLGQTQIKAEALREAQLSMLRGNVVIEAGQLRGSGTGGGVSLPPQLAELGQVDLSHPYYWSGFMMIGSPW